MLIHEKVIYVTAVTIVLLYNDLSTTELCKEHALFCNASFNSPVLNSCIYYESIVFIVTLTSIATALAVYIVITIVLPIYDTQLTLLHIIKLLILAAFITVASTIYDLHISVLSI